MLSVDSGFHALAPPLTCLFEQFLEITLPGGWGRIDRTFNYQPNDPFLKLFISPFLTTFSNSKKSSIV